MTNSSSSCTKELANIITDAWIRCFKTDAKVTAKTMNEAAELLRKLTACQMTDRPCEVSGDAFEYFSVSAKVQIGRAMVQHIRSGSSYARSTDTNALEFFERVKLEVTEAPVHIERAQREQGTY